MTKQEWAPPPIEEVIEQLKMGDYEEDLWAQAIEATITTLQEQAKSLREVGEETAAALNALAGRADASGNVLIRQTYKDLRAALGEGE